MGDQFQIFTLIIVVSTVIVSLMGFKDSSLINKLILYPKGMQNPSEYHRFLSCGFIHADEMHLAFNMIALYSIGSYVESIFALLGSRYLFLLLYITGIVFSSLPAYFKHRNDPSYAALGASGGVSAVMFAMVYMAPWAQFRIFYIIPMWSILFAVIYLFYSAHMARQKRDNIGHDAHLWGGIYGFIFTFLHDPTHGQMFLQQLTNPPFFR